MQKGYLLFGEPNWIAFHRQNSLGKQIVYCRGPGATVKSIFSGEPVFCIRSGDKSHQIHLWGYFGWYEKLPISGGWAKFNSSLGAATEADWWSLVNRLPALEGKGEFGAIVLQDVATPPVPTMLDRLQIETRGATKGRTLTPDEVSRLFRAMSSENAPESQYAPSGIDSREAVSRQILARLGQSQFRRELILRVGANCMISNCQIEELLEAAHISPYRGREDNHPGNSLLLRADLHTLFDLDLLGIHPETFTVHLHPKLTGSEYQQFDGATLMISAIMPPSPEALAMRWKAFIHRRRIDQSGAGHRPTSLHEGTGVSS